MGEWEGKAILALVGLLGWIIKTGMAGQTRAIRENTAVLREWLGQQQVRDLKFAHLCERWEEREDEHCEDTKELLRLHGDGHRLCRFNDVEADMVKRASKTTLKAGEG